MTIVRRILWRAVRLVAVLTFLWAVGAALERIGAWWDDADETMTTGAREVLKADGTGHPHHFSGRGRSRTRQAARRAADRGLSLEAAWDAHDELRAGRPVPPAR